MSLYSPILTAAGLIQDGKLSPAAKEGYWKKYESYAKNGNPTGIGALKTSPMPNAEEYVGTIKKRENADIFHTLHIDILYEKLAIQLDMPGQTSLLPVFDVTAVFPGVNLPLPFTLDQLALKLKMTTPELTVKLGDLGIKFPPQVPKLPLPEIPKPPSLPAVPPIPPGLKPFFLPDLIIGLFTIPFELLKSLLLPPKIDLVLDIPGLPFAILKLAYNLVFDLLVKLGIVIPSANFYPISLMNGINVFIDNVVSMLSAVIIGKLLGAGNLSRGALASGGLV